MKVKKTPSGKFKITDEMGFTICTFPTGTERCQYNSCLMAAVRDLLQACKMAAAALKGNDEKEHLAIIQCQKAIEKALNINQDV